MSEPPIQPPELVLPEHEDFTRLLAILETMTTDLSEGVKGLDALMADIVDLRSLAVVTMIRAMLFLDIKTGPDMQANSQALARLGMFWTEAFHAGVKWERGEAK